MVMVRVYKLCTFIPLSIFMCSLVGASCEIPAVSFPPWAIAILATFGSLALVLVLVVVVFFVRSSKRKEGVTIADDAFLLKEAPCGNITIIFTDIEVFKVFHGMYVCVIKNQQIKPTPHCVMY